MRCLEPKGTIHQHQLGLWGAIISRACASKSQKMGDANCTNQWAAPLFYRR